MHFRFEAAGAKLLFVAITSPKKENFINRWRDELGVDFVMGVGGTFDVVAGKVKRAPQWMQRMGLEWLFRVAQEPRRMWKRYLVTNSRFAVMLVQAWLQRRFGRVEEVS
ncbi:WecB/TagA/CpsF family glycosyltransferase [Caballeronia sp. RCC_10]|uniref:WecB/TagA/CpsF family glycosyltransferase n=1 Tax=Caballeronia sp. RCC_10 TaxID=3239227 RepID=UPI003524DD5C